MIYAFFIIIFIIRVLHFILTIKARCSWKGSVTQTPSMLYRNV